MCRKLTLMGIALVGLAVIPELASATGGMSENIPYYQTLFLVGLAMLCPEDINDIVNSWLRNSGPS